jgi:hypothetical protein
MLARAYRLPLLAIAASLAVHGAVLVGVPQGFGMGASDDSARGPDYVATLVDADPAAAPVPSAPAPAARKAVHRVARKPKSGSDLDSVKWRSDPDLSPLAPVEAPRLLAQADPIGFPAPTATDASSEAAAPSAPAEPMGPPDLPDLAALPEKFPAQALPSDLEINYALNSSIARAHAVYRWKRDGDRYRITGEGQADGFFSLFLEGTMEQESEGTVTARGLRPDRFVERKPNTQDEGLDFDWKTRKVTFELGERRKTGQLADDSVDWLSMIFQLAHVPPADGARDMKLQVLTQRRQYRFDLKVIGLEDIAIPMGRVRALHLRHVDPDGDEPVDVWLGVDQHYLPVKLRYPVAHNRFVVEQSATSVAAR